MFQDLKIYENWKKIYIQQFEENNYKYNWKRRGREKLCLKNSKNRNKSL